MVNFHQSQYRNFKNYYLLQLRGHLKGEFPKLVSYQRFVTLIPSVLLPLHLYLESRKGQATGVAFIDATALIVCRNRRIYSHKVFKSIAKRGKTSTGWFYGFKLHLLINDLRRIACFSPHPKQHR